MKFLPTLAGVLAAVAAVSAQDNNNGSGSSSNQSICDKYTTALLMNNTAENQLTVLTLVVNTALIGNYSNATGAPKNAVTGILNNGTYNGTPVSLLEYFDGSLASTNVNGNARAVNWLDGGGATPLMNNKPANDSSSNQYTLVTHLYEFFGTLLGCSKQMSGGTFNTYQGDPSMSQVHRFMNLNETQNNYFIQEVGLAATSFGVSESDAMMVGSTLNQLFNYRCLPPMSIGSGEAASQSICLASSCPLRNASDTQYCAATGNSFGNGTSGQEPSSANSSNTASSGTSSGSGGSGSGGRDAGSALLVNTLGALALAAAGAIAVSL